MENFASEFILKVSFKNKLPFHLDTSNSITIGNDPRCDIILSDKKGSNQIASIEPVNSALILKYLGPDNYLHFNGEYLTKGRNLFLTNGDEIVIASTHIQVLQNANVQPQETEDILTKPFVSPNSLNEKQKLAQKTSTGIRINPHQKTNTNIKISQLQATKKEATKITHTKESQPKVNFLVLNALRFYSVVIDFFITYFILTLLSFNEHFFRLSADISKFIFALITTKDPSAFLLFVLNWLILNLFQNIIFGKTIGQMLTGLTFDYKNSILNYLFKRILSLLACFIFIPIQNHYKTSKFFSIIRIILPLAMIGGILYYPKFAMPPLNLDFSQKTFTKAPRIEQSYDERFARNDNGEFMINFANNYFFYPDFSKVKTQIIFKDLIENEEMSLELVKNFDRSAITEILTFNNPFAGSLNAFNDQKFFEQALHDSLENISGSYDVALLKNKFLLSSDMKLKSFLFKDAKSLKVIYPNDLTHLAFLEIDGRPMIMIVEETRVSIINYQMDNQNSSQGNPSKLTESFLNGLNDITPIPADNNKNITLIDLISTELNKDDQTILTYYINSVKNITENQRYYGKENLTVDISYLLAKSIEQTMNLMSSQKIRSSLKNLLTELTPMEKPGGNDE